MAVPTLALIPAAQGSKLYSVLPSNGVGDFDFTRASTATRINSKGLIEEVASGVSRLDYTGGGCPHHLLEPQSTNLINYSEAFDNAYWTKTGSSVTSGFISPTGALGAFNLVEDSSNGNHSISSSPLLNVFDATTSIFVKSNGSNYFVIRSNSSGGTYLNWTFDLSKGVNTYNGMTKGFKIKSISNGWYIISSTNRSSASAFRDVSFNLSQSDVLNNNLPSHQGDGTSGVYIFGAQIEAQSYPTSYIPNFGTALGVTRLAETATGSGDASTFNSEEGVLYAEMAALADDLTFRYIVLSDGTNNNRIVLRYNNTSNQISTLIVVGGATPYILSFAVTDITQIHKIAFKWKVNNFALFIDGIKVATLLTAITFPSNTLNTFSLKSPVTSTENLEAKVKDLRVYNTALTDLEIETLTSFTSFNEMALNFNYTI